MIEESQKVLNKLITTISLSAMECKIIYWDGFERVKERSIKGHNFYEIGLILEGSGHYLEKNKEVVLQKNCLILSIPNKEYKMESSDGISGVSFSFEPKKIEHDVVEKMFLNDPIVELNEKNPIILTWISLMMTSLVYKENTSYRYSVESLTQCLLQLIFDHILNCHIVEFEKLSSEEVTQNQLLCKMKRYIRENISTPLSVDRIAHQFYISKRQVFRLFKEHESISCNHFIQQVRLEEAMVLLRTTNHSITDISFMVGFSSGHYFSKVFTEKIGITPQKFRESYI